MGVLFLVLALIAFMPKSNTVTQDQEVQAFSVDLENSYNQVTEYSTRVIVRGMNGEVSKEYDIYFKKPSMTKTIWTNPDKGIESAYGGTRYNYNKAINTLFMNNFPEEESSIIDFVDALKQYLETNEADVEDVTYDGKEAYKLTIHPRDDNEGATIYFIDKQTMWPAKIEYYLSEKRCESLKEFYNTYTDGELESCMTSEELTSLNLNPALSDDFFDIMDEIPENAKQKSGFGGECNPTYETAKPLNESSFEVLVPGWIPERATVNYPPEEIPIINEDELGPSGCARSKYAQYANVHTERIAGDPWDGEEYEVAEISIKTQSRVEQDGTSYHFDGLVTLRESPSVINWRNLAYDQPQETREVDLGGVTGTLNIYNSDHYGALIIYWKENGIYYWLETMTKETLELRNQRSTTKPSNDPLDNFPDVPLEIVFTEEEMINLASSLVPFEPGIINACGNINGDLEINQKDIEILQDYAFNGVSVPSNTKVDLNADGVLDILDVTILINYVNRNGLAPSC